MSEERELMKKRGSFKGRLTTFINYLDALNIKTLNESDATEIQLRLGKIESLYEQYDEVQTRLECITEDVHAQFSERSEFESKYYKYLAQAQSLLTKFNKDNNSISSNKSTRASNNKLVKLPTIRLPKFSGSYETWLEFHDTFTSLIHSNDDIDEINKFHYLRASLEGAAAVVPKLKSMVAQSPINSDTDFGTKICPKCKDASERAYGACVYVRSLNGKDCGMVRLLSAKSRVAPVKPTTIPRLELCGALVGARLYDKPFVRNRVADILEKTDTCIWRHVPTSMNPADLISRGVNISTLHKLDLWWSGPEFLMEDSSRWPSQVKHSGLLPETRPDLSLGAVVDNGTLRDGLVQFERFSNYLRLVRSVAYVVRLIRSCKKQSPDTKFLSEDELQDALNLIILKCQNESFPEYNLLIKEQSLPKGDNFCNWKNPLKDRCVLKQGALNTRLCE
ncbi:unnamed protein product [Euphydryas editha]|uniref:Uncharacterized protein n=1 Tax=Euphydryas editha TaxID=104508 RepID=A0AAU9URP9_EUPED|nr:unnamed protein product [Euphydryas editha]